MHITLAINNVIAAAKNNRVSLCKSNVALVVDAIRHMLIATGTIHKQSIHLRTSATLRSHHRAMMASLSKLVLSAQLCASNTADISKVISDGHELLATVRNFVTSCESKSVEINPANPLLLNTRDESDSRRISQCSTESGEGRTKYDLQPDLIESLDAYGESMQESMELLINNLTRRSDSRSSLAVLLFTQYRNFVSENSQFLSIIADIDFHDVKHSNTMKCLCSSKQLLYDGLGTLFCNMQSMTNESVSMDTMISDMQNAAQSIIHAIKSTCDYISQLVEEKHALSHERKEQNKSLISNRDEFPPDLVSSDIPLDLSSQLSSDLLKSSISTDNDSDFSRLLTPASRRHSKRVSFSGFDPYTQTPGTHTSAKLKQFFGDDIPYIESYKTDTLDSASSYLVPTNKKSEEDEQRYLHYDYHPSDIVFAKDGSVKGGTLKALVERMTLHDYLDMNFNSTFLLTYRSFCTSIELLSLLEARYNIQPPGNLSSFDLEIWTTKKQKLIRLRVFNVLKIWLEQYYYEEDSVILDRLQEFTNTSIKSTLSFSAVHLERLIQKRKEARTDFKKLVMTQQLDCPEPILPRNIKKFRLMDVDTIEMARQLTLMDFKLYSSIKPIECLDKAWSRDMKGGKNIKASIEYCNQITTWVSDSILSEHEVKKRSNLIKYWVNVADKCRTYNNFNTCMAILSAFDNSAIGRLKRTWELVGARTNHIASNIRQIMGTGRNFGQYRVLIHSVNPPCIPFLGIYLQDLTFIEDGNPNFLKSSSTLINFAKRAKTAEVIREIQQYQSMGYPFKPVEEIQSFVIEQLSSTRDEEQLYHESLKLEPKEREDEKIARLLQESGFL
ncbi:ras guanine nucleotide exchange factor domain-containing protein [Pilobolus umbonatus]|nr:ras guanine nucleotide exchange factor domain-containing protein [Pilobolus umbonatus]